MLSLAFLWGPVSMAQDSLARAQALYQAKDYQGAAQIFHSLAQKPNGATASYYLALCYHNLKASKNATTVFKHIIDRWPDSKEAKLARAYLTLGDSKNTKSTVESAKKKPEKKSLFQEKISYKEWKALPEKSRIPYRKERGHLGVNARVNGHDCKMIFDTGASSCTLSTTDFPNVIPAAVLARAQRIPMARPHGMSIGRLCVVEISLHDITRKVKILATTESGVSLIGQNFFKEYSYSIDDFYVRLTKEPFEDGTESKTRPIVAATNGRARVKGVQQNQDRWILPFKNYNNIMLVQIEVNGHKTAACFDTGCAVDGIAMPPHLYSELGIKPKITMYSSGVAERVVVGPIHKSYVKIYPAAGLSFLLIGPKIFDRPYTVDQKAKCIRFDY